MEAEYASLLRRCTKFKAITEGRRLHGELHRHGYDRRTFIANLLVQMYASCGELEQARAVFEAIEAPNVFSWNILLTAYTHGGQLLLARRVFDAMPPGSTLAWNSMISAYGRAGHTQEAGRLFEAMSARDMVTWNTVAAAYADRGHLQEAMQMLESMPAWNVVSWNPVISGFAAQRRVDQARLVFDRLLERDVVSWTAMVSAYARAGQADDALRLFVGMDLDGVQPNKVTFTAAIDACYDACSGHPQFRPRRKPDAIDQQRHVLDLIHQEAVSQGLLQMDASVGNALLNVYGKCGEWAAAEQLFESMPVRDVVSWTSMAAGAFDLQRAGRIFQLMPQRDSIAWTSAVAAFARSGDLRGAEKLLATMPHGSATGWNSVAAACSQAGDCRAALKVYWTMLLHGQRPDRSTFVVLAEACASLSSISKARFVHSHALDCCLVGHHDPELSTSLVHMYGRCGDLEAARAIFDSMPRLDAVPWNTMINLYAQSRYHGRLALELFHIMVQDGSFSPDEITSVGVLTACSAAGGLEHARRYFHSLIGSDFAVAVQIDHYICILDLLGRAGLLADAEELADSMPFQADELVWLALLSACKMHGDIDRAERAGREAFELGAKNSAPYVLLRNAFSLTRTPGKDSNVRGLKHGFPPLA